MYLAARKYFSIQMMLTMTVAGFLGWSTEAHLVYSATKQ